MITNREVATQKLDTIISLFDLCLNDGDGLSTYGMIDTRKKLNEINVLFQNPDAEYIED